MKFKQMKNDEVKEIFDEVDGDLVIIWKRLCLLLGWLEEGKRPDLNVCEPCYDVDAITTPTEFLDYIIERIEGTREFFQDWRKGKKL